MVRTTVSAPRRKCEPTRLESCLTGIGDGPWGVQSSTESKGGQPMRILSFATSMLIGAAALVTRAQAVDLDPQLPAYKPVPVGSAQIKSIGSDTLGDLMRSWADEFAKLNPNVKI